MRVVIDTNVVISRFLSPTGTPAQIFEQWQLNAFELVLSEPILAEFQKVLEYERIQARHHMALEEITEVINGFRQFAVLVDVKERLAVIEEDPEDDRFLECAVAGSAEVIVSGDAHLLDLKEYRGIQILSPAAFLILLRSQVE